MGLQSALSTALTGLRAAEATIDVVGNNVANSQTVGFKESSVNFATQFLQTQSIGAAPSSTSGGTNPRQIGLGVKVAEVTPNFTQGTIEISSNPLDVAIQGDGFLIVQGSQGEEFYTRSGQLKTNENNEVVTVTGQRVMGFNAQNGNIIENLTPLRIPIGETAVAQETENVFISGTLDPTASVATAGQVISSQILATDEYEDPTDVATLFTALESPTPNLAGVSASTSSNAAALADGVYNYRFVFVDPDGNEGALSAALSVTVPTAGAPHDVVFSGIPTLSGTSDYTGINVYRTAVGGTGDYFLAGSVLNPTTAPAFTDSTPDASLPATPLDQNSVGQTAYTYYVTYSDSGNSITETRPTLPVGPLSISAVGGRVRLKDIPQPGVSSGYDTINVYRNVEGDTSTFYRLANFSANTATSDVYMDNSPDTAISGNTVLDFDGSKIGSATLLTNVQIRSGQDFTNLFGPVPGSISFTPQKGDRTLESKSLAITSTSTVQDLVTFINQVSGIDSSVSGTSSSSASNGVINIVSNAGLENRISIGLSSFTYTPTSTGLNQPVSIPFSTTTPATGEGATTDFVVFDSLGIPLTVRITSALETKTGTNTVYRWYATSPDNEPITGVTTTVGTGLITFDASGNLVPGGDTSIAIQRSTTASQSPVDFDLDFTQVSGLANTDNLGEGVSTLNVVRQDGFPPGVLTSFAVTESGEIRGVFSNGIEETLGQIRMARFTNSAGLQQLGDNLFAEGVNSGEAQTGDPGAAGIGSLTAGAVELSNTDIGQNLIKLILASTQYRGGARVITSVQELLDELLALTR